MPSKTRLIIGIMLIIIIVGTIIYLSNLEINYQLKIDQQEKQLYCIEKICGGFKDVL